MIIHLGKKSIHSASLIGIFDTDTATMGADTRAYLSSLQSKGRLFTECTDIPKSVVLYRDAEGDAAVMMKFSTSSMRAKVDKKYV